MAVSATGAINIADSDYTGHIWTLQQRRAERSSQRSGRKPKRTMGQSETEARGRIRAYLDHLMDQEYACSIFAFAGVPTIADLLAEMIRGGDSAEVTDATLFLRDVIDFQMLPAFTDHLARSAIFSALAEGVAADQHAIRRSCIQTLGHLGVRGKEPILTAALPRYIEGDPLLLPDLLTSLSRLTGYPGIMQRWGRLRAAARGTCYLARWATLDLPGIIGQDSQPEVPEGRRRERFFGTLAADPHPFVRAEGRYLLAELHLGWEARTMPLGERRRRYWDLRSREPMPTSSRVHNQFSNYLGLVDQHDYTIAEMDAFAHYIAVHPFDREAGLEAYLQAFAAAQSR